MEHMDYPLEELIPLAAELASRYSGYEHTSVTYETAQRLMDAVLYCINEGINGQNHDCCDGAALWIKDISAKDAYLSGRNIVEEKVRELREVYNRLIPDFEDYNCECLRRTVAREIPRFLSKYDFIYAPQETLLTFDYPVLGNTGILCGIGAVLEYVRRVELEQRFLKKFAREYVIETLQMYCHDYRLLFENISSIILQNIIMHRLAGRPVSSGGFRPEETERIRTVLGKMPGREAEERIAGMILRLVEHYYDNDRRLSEYLQCAAPDIAWKIRQGM